MQEHRVVVHVCKFVEDVCDGVKHDAINPKSFGRFNEEHSQGGEDDNTRVDSQPQPTSAHGVCALTQNRGNENNDQATNPHGHGETIGQVVGGSVVGRLCRTFATRSFVVCQYLRIDECVRNDVAREDERRDENAERRRSPIPQGPAPDLPTGDSLCLRNIAHAMRVDPFVRFRTNNDNELRNALVNAERNDGETLGESYSLIQWK